MIGRVKRAIAAAAAVVVGSAALVACGAQEDEGEQAKKLFGYQVLSELRTTNAGTLEGASDFSQQLSVRLYPGVYVPGPSGQMIP
ncbi:peptide ABC transporter, partial [Corynebacterium ureicelerivorans]|nr:peptide ABC transporter [Corynebacterium ureicelerivorans]